MKKAGKAFGREIGSAEKDRTEEDR